MIKIFSILLILSSTTFGFSQTASQYPEWVATSSSVKFKIKNAGFNVDGVFSGLISKIQFDGSKSFGNLIEATIDANTVNTNSGGRDAHLKKPDYFNVSKFPKISMKATLITKEKDGTYKGYFKLTIKDKSKDFFIPFLFEEKDGKGTFTAKFTINRLDFNIGESSMILADTVIMSIEINVLKK